MPAVTNIVLTDGATTPVAHTFTPLGKDEKGVMWWEQTNPIPANPLGAKRLAYSQKRVINETTKVLNGSSLVTWSVHVPTLETLGTADNGLTPPSTLAYVEKVRISFNLPERSLKQERKDTRVFAYNLLVHALMLPTVDDLQPIY